MHSGGAATALALIASTALGETWSYNDVDLTEGSFVVYNDAEGPGYRRIGPQSRSLIVECTHQFDVLRGRNRRPT